MAENKLVVGGVTRKEEKSLQKIRKNQHPIGAKIMVMPGRVQYQEMLQYAYIRFVCPLPPFYFFQWEHGDWQQNMP